jgi:hypothetical protein
MEQTLCRRRPFSSVEVTEKSSVLTLFAEGVDVGVELALRWVETELAHCKPSSPAIQSTLGRIRRISCQAQQGSFRQKVLRGEAIRTAHVHSAANP